MKGVMLRGKKHKAVSEYFSGRTADTAFSFPGLYALFSSLPFPVSSYILSHSCRSADSLSQTASALDVSQKNGGFGEIIQGNVLLCTQTVVLLHRRKTKYRLFRLVVIDLGF